MKKKNTEQNKKNLTRENQEESIRFIEKAKEIQSEDGKDKFEKACEVILKQKHKRT